LGDAPEDLLIEQCVKQGKDSNYNASAEPENDILIVDDNGYNILAYKFIVSQLQLDVDTAPGGEEAV